MTIELKSSVLEQLSDDEFMTFSSENRDLRIERTADGQILIDMPTYSKTGEINSEVNRQLANWNKKTKLGRVFDSSSGFALTNTAMRAADAAWISHQNWNALAEADKNKFARICPDFVIEIKSETDYLPNVKEKIQHDWMDTGCQLAWLIDPETETVFVYRADGTISKITGFDQNLSGENVLPGFELEMAELRSA